MRPRDFVTTIDGEKYCYLYSDNTISGGGSYLTRVLAARNETNADVFVFVMPDVGDKQKIHSRIKRTVESLEQSVAPMKIPFRVVVSYVKFH